MLLQDLSKYPSKNFGITEQTSAFVDFLSENQNTIVVLFTNAYALVISVKYILPKFVGNLSGKWKYQRPFGTVYFRRNLVQTETLPVSVNDYFKEGERLAKKGKVIRFKLHFGHRKEIFRVNWKTRAENFFLEPFKNLGFLN